MASVYGDPCVERHSAMIYDRGGQQRLHQLNDLVHVEWGRQMDGKSQASVSLTGKSCEAQKGVLNSIRSRRHELVLYRGRERVWEGPITQAKSTSSGFTIDANDILEYLDFTPLSKRWPNSTEGGEPLMTERLREIIEYELTTPYSIDTNDGTVDVDRWENVSPAANILDFMDIRLGTTLTRSSTEAFEMSVGEHLSNLGRSLGVSYTTVGRRLVIWDGSLGRLRLVTEKDFSGDFTVVDSGGDFFNVSHVIATAVEEGAEPSVGHAANSMDYYGPWDRVVSTSSESTDPQAPSQSELNSQARRALYGLYPVPLELIAADGSNLILSAGLTIATLVAGVEIPVRTSRNIRSVKQVQRLQSLKVVETAAGESISGTLTALGSAAEVV